MKIFAALRHTLDEVERDEHAAIEAAAEVIAAALGSGHRVVAFGTGHSHALALELTGRAGGFVAIEAIHDAALAMADGLAKSTAVERLDGYGEILVEEARIAAGDVLIVISNSGRNAVPVQAALAAQERGARVIALTSVAHSRSVPPRRPATQRLCDIADVVLDNHGVPGDSAVDVAGVPQWMGPTSTAIGAVILQAVAIRSAEILMARGIEPEVYLSANV